MSEIGYTDWILADTSSNPIITDTFIDENSPTSSPSGTSTMNIKGTLAAATQKAIIMEFFIPNIKDLVDVNGADVPDDVEFSKMELRLNVTTDPTTATHRVSGLKLNKNVSITNVDWNTTDGTTAWHPDLGGNAAGDEVVYGDQLCYADIDTSDIGWETFTFLNQRKNKIGFGSNFQMIFYSSTDEIIFYSADSGTNPPQVKLYFRKPAPDAAKIELTPDSYGLNGTIDIKQHTKDANLQKYYASWDTDTTVIQSDNPLTITDIARDSIPISDLDQKAKSGTPAYTQRWPLAFNETLGFALFSEDNYNKVTNATKSNLVKMDSAGTIPIRPAISSFTSYNAVGATDTAPAIGEEMTLTIVDTKSFTEYGVLFDVEASLIDTGITWEDDVGGSTMTSTTSNAAHTKLYNSDPDGLMLGDMLKITSAAGPEFMKVVGHDSGFTVVQRAQMNTAAVNHTGLVDTTKIYKINYDDVIFTKLKSPTTFHSFKHTFSKASVDKHTSHVAAVVKNSAGWASDLKPLNVATGVIVAESNPIAKLTTSRTKVPYARYGDQTTGFTLSLANSKAIGSNREINQYGFTYDAFSSDTVATANALSNNNDGFESGSKRVSLISTGADSLTDSTWRIFGLASYESNGTSKITDTNANFSHYKYVSEQVTVGARLAPVVTTNFWKNIECVVCEEIDSDDDGNRFLLMVNPADLTSYDASVVAEGGGDGDGLTDSETVLSVTDGSFYKAGNIIKMQDELCLIDHVATNTLTIRRGYLWTTATAQADGIAVKLAESKELKHTWVNRELRGKGNMTSSNTATRYMWGGLAQIIADDIDFVATNILHLDGVTSASSFDDTDWYANGFAIGDVIKVKSNQTENGTYAAPGYYKVMDIYQTGGSGDYDNLFVARHADSLTDEEKLYVSTSITNNNTKTADIVRYDNARTPTMTCALYNYSASGNAYTGSSDTIKFEGFVVDDDTTSFILNTDSDTLTVRGVGLHTLDLNTLSDSSDIAISNFSIKRSGGASATMPLGDRRYPIGGTASKLGVIGMSVTLRILTQAGYRQIYSLIEGDRYDYVFLETNDIDNPSSSYKTYRMKLNDGTINKTNELASQYTASLNLLILGEEIS